MFRKSRKFITEFLIPSLNSEKFGDHLKWLDRENSVFQLSWCHKGVTHWSEAEAQVFVEWDKIKGHYQPDEKQYFTKSKQRFRALLYKLALDGHIKGMKSKMLYKKVFCITGVKKPRKKRKPTNADSVIFPTDDMSSNNNAIPSGDANDDRMNELCNVNNSINSLEVHNYNKTFMDNSDQKERTCIPTSGTCHPTSVSPEPSMYEESCSSSSSEYCADNEGFDEIDLELSYEYYRALNERYKRRMQDADLFKSALMMNFKIEKGDDCSPSMLAVQMRV